MDNYYDHLFVCFSDEALSAPNGQPPFHEGIEDFTFSLSEATFRDFYEKRFEWHWYPIISRGFSSTAVHGDLPDALTEEQRLLVIGYAASICAREDRRRFISALGLLSLLCRAIEVPQDVPALTKNFMRIRESVTRNAIDPNIPYWFSQVALYQLSTRVVPEGYQGTLDQAGLNAPDKGWSGYGISLDFPLVDEYGPQNCPGGQEQIQKEIESISGGEFILKYQRSAVHEGCKYWIWLYMNVSENPIYHWYVYAVMTPDGHTSIHRHSMSKVVNMTPEELVARHAFSLCNA